MTTEEILIKLGVDGTALGQGLRSAKEKVSEWGHEVGENLKDQFKEFGAAIAGFFAIEKLKEAFEGALKFGHDIELASKQLGISTDLVQGLNAAWVKLGINVEGANNAMSILSRKLGEAREGGDAAQKVFAKWGIRIDGKNLEDVFYQIADAMKNTADPSSRSAMAFDLMGKGAKDMAAALPVGAEALKSIVDSSDKLSEANIKKLEAIDVKLTEISRKWHRFWGGIVTEFVDTPAPAGISEAEILKKMQELNPKFQPDHRYTTQIGPQFGELRTQAIEELSKPKKEPIGPTKPSEESIKGAERVAKILKEAQDNEDKANAKDKTNAEQLKDLEEKRNKFLDGRNIRAMDSMQYAQSALEVSKMDLDIATKRKEVEKEKTNEAKKRDELEKSIAKRTEERDFKLKERRETELAPFQSTIDELAHSGRWGRGGWSGRAQFQQSGFAVDAQEILRLTADAKNANAWGNLDRRDADISRVNFLRGNLEKAGIVSPERRLESIDEEIKRLNKTITEGTGKINVPIAP